jgi:hypothetical protein
VEASEAVAGEAFAPLADGMAVAIELLGNLLVSRVGVRGGREDEPAAEYQGLRGRTGADQGLQLLAKFRGKDNPRAERTWHDVPPCTATDSETSESVIMAGLSTFVQTLAANL